MAVFLLVSIPLTDPLYSSLSLPQVVSYLLKRLELQSHRGIVTDGYSCGTRRKLSTALALIGHPQILLLVRRHLLSPGRSPV